MDSADVLEILDEPSRTWRVNKEALKNVENDLQAIVNCSEEGDTILLDVDGALRLSRRVTLPWRLTLSGNVRDPRHRDSVFPEARRKQRISCPRDDEGAFFVG